MTRARSRKGPIAFATGYAVLAGFDFAAGAVTGAWWDYAFGAAMVAGSAVNITIAKKRKAEPAVATDPSPSDATSYILARYGPGGFVAGNSTPFHTPPRPPVKKAPEPFAGLPFDFAVGEVYGMRMWNMDHLGRLYARNWKGLWRPGVNVAKCIKREMPPELVRYGYARSDYTYRESNEHLAPSEGCSCGFYAYTDSRHAETLSYKKDGDAVVLGIIKGSGRTLIGTQGFRCEKAEIVALRDPTRGGTKTDSWRVVQLKHLKRVYPDVPLLSSRAALLEFAPLTDTLPDATTDEFWSLP